MCIPNASSEAVNRRMIPNAKDKKTNINLQNTTQKTYDCVMRTPLKSGVNSGAPEGQTYGIRRGSLIKSVDKSRMRKRPDCDYDKQNISVVICDTDNL